MTVIKYVINKQPSNFTTNSNKVLQGLGDYLLIGLYSYISSLPHEWEFYKNHLCEYGNIGRDKLDRLLKNLEEVGLIKTEQERNKDGTFGRFKMQVNNGEDFQGLPFTENQGTVKLDDNLTRKQPFPDLPLTDNQGTASLYNIKEINNKKDNINILSNHKSVDNFSYEAINLKVVIPKDFQPNEENIRLALEKRHDVNAQTKRFIGYYLSKGIRLEDWQKCFKCWLEKTKIIVAPITPIPAEPLMKNVPISASAIQSNYTPSKSNSYSVQKTNENRSNLPFWGPGHPSYDSIHGKL